MIKSELLIPPSTASSVKVCPLSFCIASRMALVWKQVASSVALATWPRLVYAVMPTANESISAHTCWGHQLTQCSAGIINPVWCEQAAESCHEDNTSVILDGLGQLANLGRRIDEAKIVLEELDARASNGDAALQCVAWFATKVISYCAQQTVRRDHWLFANVVQ